MAPAGIRRRCAEAGATVEQMPRVDTMGTVAGEVRAIKAPLAIGAIDAVCEQIVAGADHDGDVLVMCGTTLIVWITIPEFRQVPGLWTIPHTAPGKFQIGGASNAGGLFLGWVDRILARGEDGDAREGRSAPGAGVGALHSRRAQPAARPGPPRRRSMP